MTGSLPKKQPKYLLDSNVFIEANRRYYAFDLCPGFWESLSIYHSKELVCSIDRVKTIEFAKGHDDLKKWADTKIPNKFFAASDEEDVQAGYAEAMQWVQDQARFYPFAKTEYAESVDGWLIAYAKAKGMILVTHEEPAPESKKQVKIPDVCNAIGVQYVNSFDMLRALGTKFILKKAK
ncbi:MAG: DUF4411 family protein [Bacteroidetes bacterium]|nr:DUF4411 family protein [Bacteroidota bacterium]MCL5737211.1 DUF4411 family protein [Bacteroidota bacterium]